jgi:ABC-type lipoprotein export system ATPase subunit
LTGGVAVAVEGVRKAFEGGKIEALRDVSLRVAAGEFVALLGPSGCGKSTLLNLIGALDKPDGGRVLVGGRDLAQLEDPAEYRAATVGFVFQFHNLIPTLNALENVQMPMLGRRIPRGERERRARKLLEEVGLAARLRSWPATLSGGERQRVALARALALGPQLLLADEPTGSLDWETGAQILSLLQRVRAERRMTVLLVTNDEELARSAERSVSMRDGRLALTRAAAPRSA